MRKPRNLDKYSTAEEAALALEEVAKAIREKAAVNTMVRWKCELSFWNPDWQVTKQKAIDE